MDPTSSNQIPLDASAHQHDEQQFERALTYAAQMLTNRPDGLAPMGITLGPLTVEIRGPVDDPYVRVHEAPSSGLGRVFTGRDFLQTAGMLYAVALHMREVERAELARNDGMRASGAGIGSYQRVATAEDALADEVSAHLGRVARGEIS